MPTTSATEPQERRPHPNLFKYYLLESLLLGPFFFVALIPRFLRYRTLRYRWDDQGITARWGVMFRREISLDFERIQDIHLSSNFFERWLGLAKVQVQTASGSSKAEMTVEGLQDFAEVRDFLYARMRGVRHAERAAPGDAPPAPLPPAATPATDEVVRALKATAAELRALRQELSARRAGGAAEVSDPELSGRKPVEDRDR
ncbi:MAG: PH domain-containing protein [bacterium]|nr:PH domain-containing protein [bacterium]